MTIVTYRETKKLRLSRKGAIDVVEQNIVKFGRLGIFVLVQGTFDS